MAERQRKTQALLKGKTLLSPPSSKQSARASAHAIKPLSAAAHRDKLAMYTEAFARVQEATEIDDIDELIRTFLSAEDENYTLFNYVNEVRAAPWLLRTFAAAFPALLAASVLAVLCMPTWSSSWQLCCR